MAIMVNVTVTKFNLLNLLITPASGERRSKRRA
jgi:hypothetical protein